ncbi:AMP-binding protein [Streptomyces lavendulae]|uniref:AMP-binding protein n=1 Tax=Streptomyces lavendulae TaxID=1914 RepID=UPI0024A599E0|nr:AMP-binding protein [Streptomyces lavendulae]GLX22741.1 AMP-dependent synthetase [Streptomyces lavendulae subsp. lavendulae]GLX24268.1 AMP-dependent synthetase [Streptomyces lavendulae subsp. lavendulae]
MTENSATESFQAARDFLLEHRGKYDAAHAGFTWPRPERFNWALDWFDHIATGNGADALRIVEEDGTSRSVSFGEMANRSDSAANWLRAQGVAAGDRILVMLGNQRELWEVMLGAMKLRAVVIPATPLLGPADLRDRVDRGRVRHVIARAEDTHKFDEVPGTYTRIAAGTEVPTGWRRLEDMYATDCNFTPDGTTLATDPLMLYFTSGTTASPKLVEHTHASYPIGHLSTMYWLGLRPGDVHLNIASPGWAKHAWSNIFAPWNAGATVFVHNYTRFDAERLMAEMDRGGVTTFCAPPTVWRMLIQSDLTKLRKPPREAVAAGEPLNPEVIERVRDAWGITIRDGFGQTETTLQVGNFPGAEVKPGSMGRPAPGYEIVLLDAVTGKESPVEGELCVDLRSAPAGVMTGYRDDPERTAEAMADGLYRTGDIASRDADGYLTYVGRADDVFKASDYKISPFELESALLEHEAVAEAAVVPAPDELRLAVPKAYVTLAAGWEPGEETARALFEHSRAVLSPYKRIRRIEFAELPKTVSGKIRRVELRELTAAGSAREYDEADLG